MSCCHFLFNMRSKSLVFIVALGSVLTSCKNDEQEIKRVSQPSLLPVESIRDLETLYSDSGMMKVRVLAPELDKVEVDHPYTELKKGLKIEFYDEKKVVISRLTAKYAIHYEQERLWEAKNDVVVVNAKGEQLNTEKLIWDERKEQIRSDQFVKISTGHEIIYGTGFEADQDFNHYRIFKVKGRITVKD